MQDKGSKDTHLVIYKDNLKVHLDGNYPDCCNWTVLMVQFICILCTILFPISLLITGSDEMAYLAGGYGVYLVLSCCTAACRYLCNVQTVPQVMANIEAARRADPTISFTI